MARVRYIQGKDGKMAGSVGGAGEVVPTAATQTPAGVAVQAGPSRPGRVPDAVYERFRELAVQRETEQAREAFNDWVRSTIVQEDISKYEDAVGFACTEEGARRVAKLLENENLPLPTKYALLRMQEDAASRRSDISELQKFEAEMEAGVLAGGVVIEPSTKVHPDAVIRSDSHILGESEVWGDTTIEESEISEQAKVKGGKVELSTVTDRAALVKARHTGKVPTVRKSTVSQNATVYGKSTVDGSTLTGDSWVGYADVEDSTVSDNAKVGGRDYVEIRQKKWDGFAEPPYEAVDWPSEPYISGSHLSGDTVVRGGSIVKDSLLSDNTVVRGGSAVKDSHLSGGTVVSGGSIVKDSRLSDNTVVSDKSTVGECDLSGTVQCHGTNIWGCTLKEGYFVEGDIRGPQDVRIARDGPYTYFRYKKAGGAYRTIPQLLTGRRGWGVSRQSLDPETGELVFEDWGWRDDQPDGLNWEKIK